jgi:hypothetical protein
MGEKGISSIIVIAIVVVVATAASIGAVVIHNRLSSDWPSVKPNVDKISVWENGNETIIDPLSPKFDKVGEILVKILKSPSDILEFAGDENFIDNLVKKTATLVEMKYKQPIENGVSHPFDFLFILVTRDSGFGSGIYLMGWKNPNPEFMQGSDIVYGAWSSKDTWWVNDLKDILGIH